jgi:hypothetical protein
VPLRCKVLTEWNQLRRRFGQEGSVVWATYSGGGVCKGFLVGLNQGQQLEFGYVQVSATGEVQSGRSTDDIEVLAHGRIRLHERWEWYSQAGSGTSMLEEVPT